MAILQLRSNRKSSGGRYKRPSVRRMSRLGRLPILTKVGAFKSKALRVIGGNVKNKLLSADKVNVFDPATKKHTLAKVKNILENPANRHYVRRNILTKGSIVDTEAGKARITSRPGQNAFLDAVVIKE